MSGTRDARHRLLDAAVTLLGEGGVHAATPAAVAERAGAGKMSLYRHFTGKDDLLAAALREHDPARRRRLLGDGELADADPRAVVLGIFERAAARADRPGFTGCPYVTTRLEQPDPAHPVAQACRTHKTGMVTELTALVGRLGGADPARLARAVQLVLDGAVVHAVIAGNGTPLREAADIVAILLDQDPTGRGAVAGRARQ
jgi:AcrR family transcriptional regulator